MGITVHNVCCAISGHRNGRHIRVALLYSFVPWIGLYPYCGNCYWQSTAPKQLMVASNLGGNLPLLEGFCTSNLLLVGGRWSALYSQFAHWTWFWCNWSIGVNALDQHLSESNTRGLLNKMRDPIGSFFGIFPCTQNTQIIRTVF